MCVHTPSLHAADAIVWEGSGTRRVSPFPASRQISLPKTSQQPLVSEPNCRGLAYVYPDDMYAFSSYSIHGLRNKTCFNFSNGECTSVESKKAITPQKLNISKPNCRGTRINADTFDCSGAIDFFGWEAEAGQISMENFATHHRA